MKKRETASEVALELDAAATLVEALRLQNDRSLQAQEEEKTIGPISDAHLIPGVAALVMIVPSG